MKESTRGPLTPSAIKPATPQYRRQTADHKAIASRRANTAAALTGIASGLSRQTKLPTMLTIHRAFLETAKDSNATRHSPHTTSRHVAARQTAHEQAQNRANVPGRFPSATNLQHAQARATQETRPPTRNEYHETVLSANSLHRGCRPPAVVRMVLMTAIVTALLPARDMCAARPRSKFSRPTQERERRHVRKHSSPDGVQESSENTKKNATTEADDISPRLI